MPYHKKISLPGALIGLWLINESPTELYGYGLLSPTEEISYQQIKNERRKCEFLAVRQLLKAMIAGEYVLKYDCDGRPMLENSENFISISHSSDMVAIIISEKPTGIDVEPVSRYVGKVATRFLSESEKNWISSSPDPHFYQLLCWCAKEAIFKMKRVTDVDFSKQINILPIDYTGLQSFTAEFYGGTGSDIIHLNYTTQQNNLIVWCVDK